MNRYEPDVQLQIVPCSEATIRPLESAVACFAQQLEERREQLNEDLAYYQAKLDDLKALDPLDFTGLGKIYRSHVCQIETLLNTIGED